MKTAIAVICALSAVLAAAQTPGPALHSESNIVLTPTLVMGKSGQIIYGLSAKDFIIEDNGVEQQVHLDETPDAESISLVVAVQRGGSAFLELEQPGKHSENERRKPHQAALGGLGTMVEGFLGDSRSEIAVVTFDSAVDVLQNFTEDVPTVVEKLEGIKGSGNDGAAILDAVSYSLDLLEHRPKGQTKVLLLISELRDHGSKVKLEQVVRSVTLRNTLIYSVAFSPLRAEFCARCERPASGCADPSGPRSDRAAGTAGVYGGLDSDGLSGFERLAQEHRTGGRKSDRRRIQQL
jgi:VWFA-related protein